MFSVWSLVEQNSLILTSPLVFNDDKIIELFICAEGISILKLKGIAFPIPDILIGGYKFLFSFISGPIFDKCLVTLLIGLLLRDLSPNNTTFILFDDTKPAINLIPVPELPKSIFFLGCNNAPGGNP